MLVFPNCKINLGLHVISKREDGYHTIETVFYPVNCCDALEVIESKTGEPPFQLFQSGLVIEGDIKDNILYKGWNLISSEKKLPPLKIHLHKNIPMGAGLGGGSSDAAYLINTLNEKFNLGYNSSQKMELASQLGSDCAFFINNVPVFARDRGHLFSDINISLSQYYILLVYPAIHCNTKEAYEGLIPKIPAQPLRTILESQPISNWKNVLINDFEGPAFKKHPALASLKNDLYRRGALYASMSGSGSTVFGIFEKQPDLNFPPDYFYHLQTPQQR